MRLNITSVTLILLVSLTIDAPIIFGQDSLPTRDAVRRLTAADLPGIAQRAEAGDVKAQTMLATAYILGQGRQAP